MKKKRWSIILLVILFLWPAIVQARYIERGKKEVPSKQPSKEELLHIRNVKPKDYVEGEVLVKFKKVISRHTVNNVASIHGLSVAKRFKTLSKMRGQECVLLKSDTLTTKEIMALLKKDPRVETVSPNYKRRILQIYPNDTYFGELWGLHNTGQTVCEPGTEDADIDAPEAWNINTGSSDIVVANIDTGVDYTHEDLAANMWINPGETPNDGIDNDDNGYTDDVYGIDEVNGDSDPMDDHGHGTHTSGTIAAVGNNNKGITGVNWSAKIMALKFADASGLGLDSDAIECINYVIDMKTNYGVNIVAINASWGGGGDNPLLKDAIEAAGDQGIIFCAAAGNKSADTDLMPHYPSSYNLPNIISATATDQDDNLAEFSNYGLASVDLGAPGVCILSTTLGFSPIPAGIFFDNMESGDGNWETGGTNNYWAITNEKASSPTYAWSDSPYGNYSNNTDSWLAIDHNINLSSYTGNVGLEFMAWLDLEKWYDFLYIEISKDGGANWETLGILTGQINNWDVYGWHIPENYKTANFRFRFHLSTDEMLTYDGVYIDDVGIGEVSGSNIYKYWKGTSMATPHVTGAIALMAAEYPSENIYHRINRILSGVDPTLNGIVSTEGRLNINNSISSLLTFNPFITSISPTTDIKPNVTQVTIEGIEFGATPGTVVFYDKDTETDADIVSWSDTSITVKAPSGIPGRYLRVYSSGGRASNFVDSLSSWAFRNGSNQGRDDAGAAAFNGRIYLFGGYAGGGLNCTDAAEMYDPTANSWTDIANMPMARANLTAAQLNGKLYVIGGYNDYSKQVLNTVEAYNPATDTWDTKTPLPLAMDFMKAVSLNGNIYVTGGEDASGSALNTLYLYDGSSWVPKEPMDEARFEHGAVALNGKIYVFGGYDGDYLSSGEVYDPTTDTWSSIANMPIPLARMGATTDGRYIYAIGGTNSTDIDGWWFDVLRVVLRYDPHTNTWEDLSSTIYNLIIAKLAAPAVFLPTLGIYSVNGLAPGSESTNELEHLAIPLLEYGHTFLDHNWELVNLNNSYQNPVVIMGPPTYNGSDPGVIRVGNVSSNSFEISFQEWSYLDGWHTQEQASYLVIEEGEHELSDGTKTKAGKFSLSGTNDWKAVSFPTAFSQKPILLLTCQTLNGADPMTLRARNLTASGFEVAIQEEERKNDGHIIETIGYLAIEKGSAELHLTQETASNHLFTPLLSQQIKLEEEKSLDTETSHTQETVGALVMGKELFSQIQTFNGGDTVALRKRVPNWSENIEWGVIEGIDHNWMEVPLYKEYTDPVIIAKPVSNRGVDPGVIRLRNVSTNSFELRYQEWKYLDGGHTQEQVFYLVAESGAQQIGSALLPIEAGKINSTYPSWEPVDFSAIFSSPTVFASVETFNGSDPVTTRTNNVSVSGSEMTMQEEERSDGWHTSESIGWIAIEVGQTTIGSRKIKVFSSSANSSTTQINFGTSLSSNPVVVSDISTTNGLDPCFIRFAEVTPTYIKVFLAEEKSLDTETWHTTENISLFVAD